MYVVNVGVASEDEMKKILKVCEDTKIRDDTFLYEIKKSRSKKFKYILSVKSQTEEIANKRGGWLIHKVNNAKVSDYFWVREVKT